MMATAATGFEKFSVAARTVLQLAHEEAQRFNHNYIGTEHLLLGLVRETQGVALRVLQSMDVDVNKITSAVEFIVGRGERPLPFEIGLTPRAKKVIELATDEARRRNHHYIGTEHLLVGIMREGEGVAAGVLGSLGVTVENLRAALEAFSPTTSSKEEESVAPVSDQDIAQAIHDLNKARSVLLRLQAERKAQKPQEPSA